MQASAAAAAEAVAMKAVIRTAALKVMMRSPTMDARDWQNLSRSICGAFSCGSKGSQGENDLGLFPRWTDTP